MAERMTAIDLPGHFDSGLADWGVKSVEEMVSMLREKAARDKAVAEAILAASDDDFRVQTYRGVHVRHDRKILQKGKK